MKKIISLFIAVFAVSSLFARPGDMVLEAGPYKVVFEEKNFYCSAQYFYDGVEMGNRNGYYGTIFASSQNKFVGSGHNEGGNEKILSTKLLVDGVETKVEPKEFKGSKLEFSKVSMLNNLKVFAKITITPEDIIIDKSFEAVDEQKFFSIYIFQFCWSEKTDKWMILRPNGTYDDGVFNSNEGWFLRSKENELRSCTLYNSNAQKGILGFFSKYFHQQGNYYLWDRKVYHKFYFPAAHPKLLTKGYKSPEYQLVLKGFSAAPDKWQDTVKQLNEEFDKKYPLPEAPKKIELFKTPKKLVGNEKFLYDKNLIQLAKNKKYTVSFDIKKSGEISPKPHYHYVLIGQHDAQRKFNVFRSMTTQIKNDGQWHNVKAEFTTPSQLFETSIIFYNCFSKGEIEYKNVVIEQQ